MCRLLGFHSVLDAARRHTTLITTNSYRKVVLKVELLVAHPARAPGFNSVMLFRYFSSFSIHQTCLCCQLRQDAFYRVIYAYRSLNYAVQTQKCKERSALYKQLNSKENVLCLNKIIANYSLSIGLVGIMITCT